MWSFPAFAYKQPLFYPGMKGVSNTKFYVLLSGVFLLDEFDFFLFIGQNICLAFRR